MLGLNVYILALAFCTSSLCNPVEENTPSCHNCTQNQTDVKGGDAQLTFNWNGDVTINGDYAQCETISEGELGSSSFNIQMFISFQKETIRQTLVQSKDLESQIKRYKEFLSDKKSKHEELIKKIHDLANKNNIIIKQMDDEHERLNEMKNHFDALRKRVKEKLPRLYNATDIKGALDAIYELDPPFAGLEKWISCCDRQVPNAKIIISSEKLLMETKAALLLGNYETEAMAKESNFSGKSLTILEKIDQINEHGALTLKRLQELWKKAKGIFSGGLVYAVQSDDAGNIQSANISIKHNRVYLHHLKHVEAPPYAHTIKQSQLLKLLDTNSTEVFMDLAWEGFTRGRVYILLAPDSSYVRQFRMLCTGDLGQSYAHSNFSSVGAKNNPGEYIIAGDYDGQGATPIIEGLGQDDNLIKLQDVTGIVWINDDLSAEGPRSAAFGITTGTGQPNLITTMIGQVQDGLEVIKEAVQVNDISQVEIIDSGVVLPI